MGCRNEVILAGGLGTIPASMQKKENTYDNMGRNERRTYND